MKDKIIMLRGMHEMVRHLNNEEYYMKWILIVPDEPQDDDFEFIANDEELFPAVLNLFTRIISRALSSNESLIIDNKVYSV